MKEKPARQGVQDPASIAVSVHSVTGKDFREHYDDLAVEEPVEFRIVTEENGRPARHSIAITMRTPGDDFELAAGFLFSEGVVTRRKAIRDIRHCGDASGTSLANIVNIFLAPGTPFDPRKFTRNVYTTSSCGVCGKTSLEMLRAVRPSPLEGNFILDKDFFLDLPEKLDRAQDLFPRTGGLHATALFDLRGKLLRSSEDVGRHNAMDKVVGGLFLEGLLPASETVVMVSGRASFELVQKAILAGIPVLAAVGAPTSLAVEMAREFRMTLVGFLRDGRFNVYSGEERIALRK